MSLRGIPCRPGCLDPEYGLSGRIKITGYRTDAGPGVNTFKHSLLIAQSRWPAALEHLKAGASISAVAREFGTSRQTIMRLRDDAVSPELPE